MSRVAVIAYMDALPFLRIEPIASKCVGVNVSQEVSRGNSGRNQCGP